MENRNTHTREPYHQSNQSWQESQESSGKGRQYSPPGRGEKGGGKQHGQDYHEARSGSAGSGQHKRQQNSFTNGLNQQQYGGGYMKGQSPKGDGSNNVRKGGHQFQQHGYGSPSSSSDFRSSKHSDKGSPSRTGGRFDSMQKGKKDYSYQDNYESNNWNDWGEGSFFPNGGGSSSGGKSKGGSKKGSSAQGSPGLRPQRNRFDQREISSGSGGYSTEWSPGKTRSLRTSGGAGPSTEATRELTETTRETSKGKATSSQSLQAINPSQFTAPEHRKNVGSVASEGDNVNVSSRLLLGTLNTSLDLDVRGSQSNRSRADSDACSAKSPRWEGIVNVPVKNTFLDFSDTEEDVDPRLRPPVRRTRSLENFTDMKLKKKMNDMWTCTPSEWVPASKFEADASSCPDFSANRERVHDLQVFQNYGFSDDERGGSEEETDIIERIKACHGNAAALAPLGMARASSWPNSMKDAHNQAWENAKEDDDDDLDFEIKIEELDEPVNTYKAEVERRAELRRRKFPSSQEKGAHNKGKDKDFAEDDSRRYSGGSSSEQHLLQRVSSCPNMHGEGDEWTYYEDRPRITQFGGVEYAHTRVPKRKNLRQEFQSSNVPMTTIMIRNIPNRYRQNEFVQEINMNGLEATYDFVYLPMDKSTTSNVGYAFVNFLEEDYAVKAMQVFTGYRFSKYQNISRKIASVSIAHIQGFEANLKHYNQSAVNDLKVTENRPLVMATISRMLQR